LKAILYRSEIGLTIFVVSQIFQSFVIDLEELNDGKA